MGMVLFTLDKYLRGELLSHRVILLTLRNHQIVVPFTFPPAPLIGTCVWGFFLEPSECGILVHVKWCHTVVLLSVSLMIHDFEQFFMSLLAVFI